MANNSGVGTMYTIEQWPLERLIPYVRNPRVNDHAVAQVAGAIKEFGFRVPIVAKSDGTVVDGHLRLKAARQLGLETVPVLLADDLTESQIKAFRLSVNKLAELATWDEDLLRLELEDLDADGFDLGLTGFDAKALDALLGADTPGDGSEPSDNDGGIEYQEHYSVLVECDSEAHQAEVYEKLKGDGYACKVLVN